MNGGCLFGPFFIFAGVMHFVIPRAYAAIVPPQLPNEASGRLCERSGGDRRWEPGCCIRGRAKAASVWSVATLLAVFPANVHMALHPERYRVPGGRLALYLRLPVQALFIAWAIAARRD